MLGLPFSMLAIFLAGTVHGRPDAFAVGLYKAIASSESDVNIAISPFSAEAALSMTYVGAAGLTKTELASALGIGQTKPGNLAHKFKAVNATASGYTLQSANGIFLEKTFPILPAFRGKVVGDFGANISSVDFIGQAEVVRQEINAFVAEKTGNKIQDIFEPNSLGDSVLVLVNAVYFKADWASIFERDLTSSQPFTLASGEKVNVNLMNQNGYFAYTESAELGGAQVLVLPYQNGEASMMLVLPTNETGLQALENNLTLVALETALSHLSSQRVEVFLPKFRIEEGYDLVKPLKSMGIQAAFTDNSDFSGITAGGRVKISKVVQKVFLEVNEEGTEAAAATGVRMVPESLDETESKVFRADRAFLYAILHKQSKAVVFMGRVAIPSLKMQVRGRGRYMGCHSRHCPM